MIDDSLYLSHPNIGEGVMQAAAPDMAAWDWEDALFADADTPSLSDVELAWDCSNTELPRWVAHVSNPDGPDLQLDLVAVTELTILGRVSIPEDGRMEVYRRIVLMRDSFPIDGLEPRVFTSDQCDKLCGGGAVMCPDRP